MSKYYLTRQRNGSYMLTLFKPICTTMIGSGQADAYVKPGDPVGLRNLCPELVRHVFKLDEDLDPLESTRGWLNGGLVLETSGVLK